MSPDVFEEQLRQLVVHPLASLAIPRSDRLGRAVLQVVPQQELGDGAQRLLNRGDLDQHLAAVALLPNHPQHAAHLPLDALELHRGTLLEERVDGVRFSRRFRQCRIPLPGIVAQTRMRGNPATLPP